jgi:hypothetical protein
MARLSLTLLLGAATAAVAAPVAAADSCVTQSAPNPLRAEYPNDITGTLNGTLIAWLVDLDYAKSLVEYPLLINAARAKYPDLPAGKFPLFADPVLNFDGGLGNFSTGSFQRTRVNVPFVDRLSDGFTSFRANLPMAISQSIIDQSAAAGLPLSDAHAATTDPTCNGYEAVPGSGGKEIFSESTTMTTSFW